MNKVITSYDKLISSVNNLIRTLKIYPKVFEESKFHELCIYYDKALFTALNQMDLVIGLKYLDLSQALGNGLEANYFSRVVILNSHEILNDLNKMVGKKLRTDLVERGKADELKRLDQAIKAMAFLRKKHIEKLKILRNTVLAHKLSKAHKQSELIANIKPKEVYDIGNEIFKGQMFFFESYLPIIHDL